MTNTTVSPYFHFARGKGDQASPYCMPTPNPHQIVLYTGILAQVDCPNCLKLLGLKPKKEPQE